MAGEPAIRVALFTETFLPNIDGVVTRLRHTVAELQKAGDQVMVFAPGQGISEYHGAVIERVPGHRFPLYPELTLGLPSPRFRKQLTEFCPDVVHAADPAFLGVGGLYYADVIGYPLVVSYHTRIPSYLQYYGLGAFEPLVWSLMRFRHRLAAVNLCTSGAMADELRSHGIERVQVWPKAVDTDQFHPRFANSGTRRWLSGGAADGPLFVYVGRLSREKNVEALAEILDALPGARLAVIGGGPHQHALQVYYRDRPVVFTGYVTGDRLASAMASADAVVLPSQTETLGFVLMEAMAAGCLVIGANRGGIPDVIRHEVTGLLFDAGKPKALAEAALSLTERPELCARLRVQARKQAESWSWTEATRSLRGFYEMAIGMPRRRRSPLESSGYVQVVKRAAIGGLKIFLR